MKRTAIWSIAFAIVLASTGCQTVQRFAWFKRDKAPEDTSAVARSAKPELPSAQTSPQAVAVQGLTPAAPPSSTNLAASATPATAAAAGAPTPPSVSIPVMPSASPATATATPSSQFPTDNGLADKLVTPPSTKPGATSGIGATSVPAVPSAGSLVSPKPAAVAAAGPYDPNAYKPSATATAADDSGGAAADVDRYGISSSVPASSPATGALSSATTTASSSALQSDPADRYGSPRNASAAATMPSQSTLPDPASVAADRYANPNLPSLPATTPSATTTSPATAGATSSVAATGLAPSAAGASAPPAVRLASAPGQFRPGRTSSYNGAQLIPVEVATRPAPPATSSAAPSAATSTPTQPWAPPAATSPAGSRY